MMSRRITILLLFGSIFSVSVADGQSYRANQQRMIQNGYRTNGVRYGAYGNNYGANGYNGGYGGAGRYPLSPYLNYIVPTPEPTLPPVSGPVEKYSKIEHGEIVKMSVDAARKNNPGIAVTAPNNSIVDIAGGSTSTADSLIGPDSFKPVTTSVSDVLDRGVILLPTTEELRLRGVVIPSITDTNDVLRLYAQEAMDALRQLTQGKDIYVMLEKPLRDSSGRLLGKVMLADGTDLNKRMLELGYGSLREADFPAGEDLSQLKAAQESARNKRLGIWSR